MDKEKKLRVQIIVTIVITVLLTLAMAAAWAKVLVMPLNEQLVKTSGELATAKSTAGNLQKNKLLLEEARVKEKRLNVQLAFFRNRYRSFDFGSYDPAKPDAKLQERIWRNWMHEFSYNYGPRLWGEMHGAANASGVVISKGADIGDIKTEAPPKGPENITIPANGFFKPTGSAPFNITVTGTLDQIMTFMRRIHEGQILMKVGGGLKLEGSSPRVQATFTVQPYLVARGANVTLSAAGAAPAAAAGSTTVQQVANAATTPLLGNGNAAPP